jgi:hypothetical protein
VLRANRLCALGAFLVAFFFAMAPARAGDPDLRWYTIETQHFRVTYHSGIEQPAQHVATIAEQIFDSMAEHVGHRPTEITEILLTDFSEAANGSASALPFNSIRLIVTAPDDMSPLGDVDDWFYELVSHEFTHVLHTDNIHGLSVLVNAILGKTLAPNQTQPRWILEGLAVYHETARTSGGRLRNSMWDMFMRTDVLDDNVATIDQVSHTVRRWPQGNLYYLYGSYFTGWIAKTYGEDSLRRAARDYGGQIIPWGFNRSIRRATGKTYVEMYPEWIESMKKEYGAQADAVRKAGIREGVRVTYHGQDTRYPRWIPRGAWPEHEGGLVYFRDDERDRNGIVVVDVQRDARGAIVATDALHGELVARTQGFSYASFTPDGSLVYSSEDVHKNIYFFGDLEMLVRGKKSPFGYPDGGRIRLTDPAIRADQPTVSPDGRHVVFNTNNAGTRAIMIGDLGASGVTNIVPFVPTAFSEQAFTPRYSPDGTHVAYSVWKRGGNRDIRYVDVRDGSYRDITNDRAVDGGPSFSPDGRFLYFNSDRTGIQNLYAWEIDTDRFFQITNVITGAYDPDPSPDGRTLAYLGYTKDGFDVYAMPIDQSQWTPAQPYVDDRPATPVITPRQWTVQPYNPWPTLLPRKYGIQITDGAFGKVVIATASATDLAGIHAIAASTTTELEKPELQGTLSYVYDRLPFEFAASLYRAIAPRAGYALGGYKPTVVQETTGFATSINYALPRAFDTNAFTITHALSRVGAELPIPIDKLDPYETPSFPQRGLASTLHLGYSYTNAERYLWSVGPERGISFNVGLDFTHPNIGSDFDGFVADADLFSYWKMPWLRAHSLAAHVGGGTSGGGFPGRGAFFVGSFVDLPVVDTIQNILIQGGITLRGYQPVAVAGRNYLLTNLEYRFPILNVDRGIETLPVFLNRINGAFFFDYGSAFDDIEQAKFKTGAGGELWFDFTLGYLEQFTFRLGFAHGFASGGIDKLYFVAAIPF